MNTTRTRLLSTTSIAVALVAASALDVLEQALSPLASTTTRADVIAISQHQTRFVVSVLVGVAATLLFLPGMLGLASRTVDRAPVASRIAAVLVGVGLPGFMAIRMGQAFELQGIRDGLPTTATADLVDHVGSNPIGVPIVVCFLAGTVLGVIALGVAAWRAGLPRPAAVLVAAFGITDLLTEGVVPGWASHLVLLVGMTWIAVALVAAERTQATAPATRPAQVGVSS